MGSIRFAGKIPWLLIPAAPATCLASIAFILTLAPYAGKVYEKSRTYLGKVGQNSNRQIDKNMVKSLRPLDIEIGPYGRVDRGLLPEIRKSLIGSYE